MFVLWVRHKYYTILVAKLDGMFNFNLDLDNIVGFS